MERRGDTKAYRGMGGPDCNRTVHWISSDSVTPFRVIYVIHCDGGHVERRGDTKAYRGMGRRRDPGPLGRVYVEKNTCMIK